MAVMIRPFNESDISSFYEAVTESIDHLGKWLPWCTQDYTLNDAEEWVLGAIAEWQQGFDYRFVICEDDKPETIIGSVGVNHINFEFQSANLGYWIRTSALQQGIARSACLLACEYAFHYLQLTRLEIAVLPENTASNHLAQSLGAVFEGLIRNKIVVNDSPKDANCYSLIPSDISF